MRTGKSIGLKGSLAQLQYQSTFRINKRLETSLCGTGVFKTKQQFQFFMR